MNRLNNLEKRNNNLKSLLRHDKLIHGNYIYKNFKREMFQVLNEYSHHKSLFKASSACGINHITALKWYIQGQNGNPQFRFFYLRISHINNFKNDISTKNTIAEGLSEITEDLSEIKGDFKISHYGDGWSYTAYIDGEKIFIISNDLENLKSKVMARNLPLN